MTEKEQPVFHDHNRRVLEKLRGLPAQASTPESEADPQNPNLPAKGPVPFTEK